MADIMLAEWNGRTWLVRGEQHIDDLLANTLPPDVSITVVPCESKRAVDGLWGQWNDGDPSGMWLIHPGVADRVRGKPVGSAITFPPWSAQLDDAAQRVIDITARAAAERPDARVALVCAAPADGAGMAEDLTKLRCGLLEARLVAAGLDAARLVREARVTNGTEEADQVELLLR